MRSGRIVERSTRPARAARNSSADVARRYNPRMRRLLLVAVIVTLGIAAAAQSGRAPAGIGHEGNAFRFNKVRDGVYHAVGTGALAVVGNSTFIVNDDDVVVVDDHVSPAAAWVLLDEIRAVTNKPVTTVINTHFHFDHAHGNQIFDSRVNIIGHEFTRQMLLSNSTAMPLYRNYVTGIQPQIDDLKKRVAAETDAAKQAALKTQIAVAENNKAAQAELKPTPPNVTLTDRMTLYRGGREIQIRFLGRGHTGGDVVVFLPRGEGRRDRGLSDGGPLEHERRVCRRMGNVARLAQDARLRYGASRPRRSLHRQGEDRILPGYLRDVWAE